MHTYICVYIYNHTYIYWLDIWTIIIPKLSWWKYCSMGIGWGWVRSVFGYWDKVFFILEIPQKDRTVRALGKYGETTSIYHSGNTLRHLFCGCYGDHTVYGNRRSTTQCMEIELRQMGMARVLLIHLLHPQMAADFWPWSIFFVGLINFDSYSYPHLQTKTRWSTNKHLHSSICWKLEDPFWKSFRLPSGEGLSSSKMIDGWCSDHQINGIAFNEPQCRVDASTETCTDGNGFKPWHPSVHIKIAGKCTYVHTPKFSQVWYYNEFLSIITRYW